jgi:hypothetical protein
VRSVRFYDTPGGAFFTTHRGSSRDNPKVLHIETEGCYINIQVGLRDSEGRLVTRVDVQADSHSRGGDGEGNVWQAFHGNAQLGQGGGVIRVIMTEGRDAHDQEAGR